MNTEESKKPKRKLITSYKEISPTGKKVRLVIFALALVCCGELVRSNCFIDTENFTFKSKAVPKGFDGVKIVQISDYHNHGGNYEDRLIETVKKQNPDMIFLTGDMVDDIETDIEQVCDFLVKVSKIADCYCVWGNHEYAISGEKLAQMEKCCEENGITVLENDLTVLEINGDKMLVVGTVSNMDSDFVSDMLKSYPDEKMLTLWLHHYPEDFHAIVETSENAGSKADLLFCGHAHGGLIEIPFTKVGIYAPGQGFLPEYTGGEYEYNGSKMLLSRGVGNSGKTLRLFDQFHLVVCTLKSE